MKPRNNRSARSIESRPQTVVDARCRVEMLGSLRLIRADLPEPITRFALQKAGALLAFLALSRRPHPRERLADLFWPDMELPAARDNLSTTLGSLRRQIEPPGIRRGQVLLSTHSQVGLNPAAVSTDVADFESQVDRAAASEETAERAHLLQQAMDLYQGDLLPEFYYDWSVREMVRLQGRAIEALQSLADALEALGDLTAALKAAQRLIILDNASEEAHAHLIRLLVRTGRPKESKEAYQKFVTLFEEEFGAPPSVESRQEIEALLARSSAETRLPRTLSAEPTAAPMRVSAEPAPAPAISVPVALPETAPPLPVILSRFFGREPELEQLARLLLPNKGMPEGPQQPEKPHRLVSLIGPGGVGKTRLALEFLHQAAERFGLWCGFVSLVDVSSPAHIPEAIATVLKIPPASTPDITALDQVAAFLAERSGTMSPSAILALDNLEHLLPQEDGPMPPQAGEAALIVQHLLEHAPGLSILCTSRQRLGLRGERRIPLGPLPVPEIKGRDGETWDLEDLFAIPSVRLYLDRAQAARPDVSLTHTNAPAIAALCRQLEGSPLAIELAAAWVRMLPPRKMWERLQQGLDIPEGSYSDLPARHRSLSAALEWSYRLLSPAARQLFARLSVFVGGWTLDAAAVVVGAQDTFETMRLLAALQEASLLNVQNTEGDEGEVRYRFLETVRTFAQQQLEDTEEREALQRRHADHFLAFVEAANTKLQGPEQALWLSRLEADHDNIRAALDYYLASSEDDDLEQAVRLAVALRLFWRVRGHWHEGERRSDAILARTAGHTLSPALRAGLLAGVGSFALLLCDLEKSVEFFEASLEIQRTLDNRSRVSALLHNLGLITLQQGDYDRARPYYQESLAICRELGDELGIADELHHLGWLAHEQGRTEEAETFYQESLAVRRPLGEQRGLAYTLNNLANIATAQGDLDRAHSMHEECLAIRQELGDRNGVANSYLGLGAVSLEKGDLARARALYAEALAIFDEMSDLPGLTNAINGLGKIAIAMQDPLRALQLFSAAHSLRTAVGIASQDEKQQQLLARARTQVEAEAFERAWAAGQSMTRAEAFAFARAGDA